jgi:hypothetical protein
VWCGGNNRGEFSDVKTSNSSRAVPLGLLLEDFRSLRPADAADDDLVFQRDATAICSEITSGLPLESLGFYFEGFGWHTFRRQNLTLMQEEGPDLRELCGVTRDDWND